MLIVLAQNDGASIQRRPKQSVQAGKEGLENRTLQPTQSVRASK
jgi:hypothetical protein